MKLSTIYMDNNATTPIDPRVRDAMLPFLAEAFGNASSATHAFGWQAEMGVSKARSLVAKLLGAKVDDVIFTSGATESNNLAILGVLDLCPRPSHLITSAVEHKAVLEVADEAKKRGHEVTVLPVDEFGMIRLEDLRNAIRPNTKLISVMWANNEIGSLNPITKIGALAKDKGILFHTDAAQAAGRVTIDVDKQNIDLLSLSGHKIYGPKGVGALYVRRDKVELKPQTFGGSQEWGLRPGTLNVPGIVGLGAACEIFAQEGEAECARLSQLREQIWRAVSAESPDVKLNGHPTERLSGNLSLSLANLKSDLFALGLNGIACSSGSACTSNSGHSSHVLKAIGLDENLARATLRLGLGRFTSSQDVDTVIQRLLGLLRKNRELSR